MTERIPKTALVGGAVLGPVVLAYLAYSRPWYFIDRTYLSGLLFLEFLLAAVWMYRRAFFPLIMIAFLFAGSNLPVGSGWTAARWLVLGVGALVGCVIMLKERGYRFGWFHAIAAVAFLAAMVSAEVSRYPSFALLKALSLILLFVYAATGARLAAIGRESRFFAGLLMGCEIFFAAIAVLDLLLGMDPMGNPNSLGAVTGVVGAPILLWGTLVAENKFARRRRLALYAICMYLVFHSHARAGMAAAAISCGLLCLTLRKYRLLAQGVGIILILVAASAIIQPEAFSNTVSSVTSVVVYKGDPEHRIFASRQSTWQAALDDLRGHFWFGTGFGTTDNGQDAGEHLGTFSSSSIATAENGSSYLAITMWVGMLGVLPFFLLLLMLVGKILRTIVWMLKTGNPSHPAVPLAMIVLAGMLHASLEDWLFAPGYYLCVFFWSLAFILVDLAPTSRFPQFAFARRLGPVQKGLSSMAPSR